MMKKLAVSAALAALAAAPLSASANTPISPVGPTVTVLTATPTLVGAGVGVSALGTGSLSFDASGNAVGLFPITGGFLDPDRPTPRSSMSAAACVCRAAVSMSISRTS
jgi:hypothetical protein